MAIGECGLDFNRNFSPPDVQIEVFEKQESFNFNKILVSYDVCVQVMLACELCKPLFLHERDAHTEMVEILVKYSERYKYSDLRSSFPPRTLQITTVRHSLLHWDQRAGSEVSGARLLYWSHWIPLEGQVRERGEENSGGRNHSPG